MRVVAQGSSISLTSQFAMSTGQLIDPDNPYVDLMAPDGSVVLAQQPVVRTDIGSFSYTFFAATDADLGEWTIEWFGSVNGQTASVSETFSVVPSSEAQTTASVVTRLRRLIGERIGLGKTEADTRFLNQEISDTYYANNEDWNKTLAELWMAKAAYLGDFVDISESGTQRSLSQMARAAMAQATKYEAKVQVYETAWQATYRVPARSFSPYRCGTGSRLAGVVVVFATDPQRAWTV